MDKYFVYRRSNSYNQYWSVNRGSWVKYEWATIYSQDEIDLIHKYSGGEGYSDGEWVRHGPPNPTPVIIGDNSRCKNPGKYWMRFMYPDGNWSVSIQDLNEQSTFWEGVMYVYIPEPNWPN